MNDDQSFENAFSALCQEIGLAVLVSQKGSVCTRTTRPDLGIHQGLDKNLRLDLSLKSTGAAGPHGPRRRAA